MPDFEIRLDLPDAIPREPVVAVAYDPELDTVQSILSDICDALAELPGVGFALRVHEVIPVDVRLDLVTALEQLGTMLEELRSRDTAVLELYEQGIELQLVFARAGDQMRIEPRDLLGRPTHRRPVHVDAAAVIGSLALLARRFVAAAGRRSPERVAHPWFVEWARALLSSVNAE